VRRPDPFATVSRSPGKSPATRRATGRGVTSCRSSGRLSMPSGNVMHAHRTRVRVAEGRRVTVNLPSDFPEGEVEVIVLPTVEDVVEEQTASRPRRLSVDEFLASRLAPPPGVAPVSLADIERAIVDGALGRGDV
jgi:hypothetical protein